jgi:hypothetical protein
MENRTGGRNASRHTRYRHPSFNSENSSDLRSIQLETNDDTKTLVARSHRGSIGKSRSLEIFPIGMKIIDAIVVTFLYVETKRTQRE